LLYLPELANLLNQLKSIIMNRIILLITFLSISTFVLAQNNTSQGIIEKFKNEYVNKSDDELGNKPFNQNYELDSIVEFDFNHPIDSIPVRKRIYNYEMDGNNIIEYTSIYNFDPTINAWDEITVFKTIYDENENILERSSSSFLEFANEYIPFSKTLYSYENDTIKRDSTLRYDYLSTEWNFTGKTEYTYGSSEDVEEYFTWEEEELDWRPSSKYVYVEDNDITIEIYFYIWSTITNSYTPVLKYGSEEDEMSENDVVYIYQWDPSLNDWVWQEKSEFDVSEEDFIIITTSTWNPNILEWELQTREVDERDDYLFSRITRYGWNKTDSIWVEFDLEVFERDSEGNSTLDLYYLYDESMGVWVINNKEYYYYSDISSVTSILESDLKLFPNPTANYLNFVSEYNQASEITIYDTYGSLVMQKELNSGDNISVDHLVSSIYFYTIKQENKVYSGKFIKQ